MYMCCIFTLHVYCIFECRKESHRKKSNGKKVSFGQKKKSRKKSHRIGFNLVFLNVLLVTDLKV